MHGSPNSISMMKSHANLSMNPKPSSASPSASSSERIRKISTQETENEKGGGGVATVNVNAIVKVKEECKENEKEKTKDKEVFSSISHNVKEEYEYPFGIEYSQTLHTSRPITLLVATNQFVIYPIGSTLYFHSLSNNWPSAFVKGHEDNITALTLSEDHEIVISISRDCIIFWSVPDFKSAFSQRPLNAYHGNGENITVATPTENHANFVRSNYVGRAMPLALSAPAITIAMSRDNRLACAYEDIVTIIDITTGQSIALLQGHVGEIIAVSFVNNDILCTTSADHTFKIWSLSRELLVYSSPCFQHSFRHLSVLPNSNDHTIANSTTVGEFVIGTVEGTFYMYEISYRDAASTVYSVRCAHEANFTKIVRKTWRKFQDEQNALKLKKAQQSSIKIIGNRHHPMAVFQEEKSQFLTSSSAADEANLDVDDDNTTDAEEEETYLQIPNSFIYSSLVSAVHGPESDLVLTPNLDRNTLLLVTQLGFVFISLSSFCIIASRWFSSPQRLLESGECLKFISSAAIDGEMSTYVSSPFIPQIYQFLLPNSGSPNNRYPHSSDNLTLFGTHQLNAASPLSKHIFPSVLPKGDKQQASKTTKPSSRRSIQSSGYGETHAKMKLGQMPKVVNTGTKYAKMPGQKKEMELIQTKFQETEVRRKDNGRELWKEFNSRSATMNVNNSYSTCKPVHNSPVSSVRFSSSGEYLITGSTDCTSAILKLKKGNVNISYLTGHSRGVNSAAFPVTTDPFTPLVAITSSDDMSIRFWHVSRNETLLSINTKPASATGPPPQYPVLPYHKPNTPKPLTSSSNLVASPSEKSSDSAIEYAAFGYGDRFIFSTHKSTFSMHRYALKTLDVTFPRKSPNSSLESSNAKSVFTYTLDNSQQIYAFMNINSLQSPYVYLAGGNSSLEAIDLTSGSVIRQWQKMHDTKNIHHISSFFNDAHISSAPTGTENLILTAAKDGNICAWDLRSSYEQCVFRFHSHICRQFSIQMAASNVGGQNYVVSGSEDGKVYLYDTRKSSLLNRFSSGNHSVVNCVAFHPLKPMIAMANFDGQVKFLS